MFWTQFLYYLKVIWLFIKKYWSLFLFGVLLLVSIIFFAKKQQQVQNLLKMLQDASTQHHNDLAELQRIHEEEIKQREELQRQYDEQITRINKEHAEAIANLNREKEQQIKELIKQFQDDPDKMADEINSLLGIPIQRR